MEPLADSPIEEVERTLLPAVLRWTFVSTVVFTIFAIAVGFPSQPGPAVLSLGTQAVCWWASKRYPNRAVAIAYFVGMSAYCVWNALYDGGSSSQAYYSLVVMAQGAVLLLGRRGLLLVGPLVLGCGVALVLLESRGLLPEATRRTPLQALLWPLGVFLITAAVAMDLHQRMVRLLKQAHAQAHVSGKMNKQLSLEIGRRAEIEHALQEAVERALEASRVKSTLLANVSHELRTPMNAVVGLTDLLLQQNPTPTQREHLETVRLSSESLLVLLDDLLDLSKIESGVLHFESKPFSPIDAVFEVKRLLGPRAEAKGITLEVVPGEGVPPFVLGDPARFRQVLVNLVGNAVKFTSVGGVVLHLSWQGERLHVSVKDSGIGIPSDKLQLIFEPFVQADTSTTRRFGGTGLGLAIVKRLLDAQQGQVRVESVLGKGSTFLLELPAPRTASRPTVSTPNMPAAGASLAEASLEGLRVLLVEDNAVNELVGVRLLKHLGVEPQVARDGRKALEACAEQPYDIVLMDMQMPEMDGLAATRALRATHGAAPYVIALTANATLEDRTHAQEAGADAFLAKPVHLEELKQALHKATKRILARAP